MGCAYEPEENQWFFIVCNVHLYRKITSFSYCMGCASVREDNHCKLFYGLCIYTGRLPLLVILWVVHLYVKITSVSYCMVCSTVL